MRAVPDIVTVFRDFIGVSLEHPQGPEVARAFDRTFQFDLTDGPAFYMTLQGGQLTVREGDSGLDWKYKDWERCTCVHTSTGTLYDIMAGRKLASEAFFDRELGFAPRRLADKHTDAAAVVSWFYALIRLAIEQGQRRAYAGYLEQLGVH